MKELISNSHHEYGQHYPYLLKCQENWKKFPYRAWCGMRAYLEVARPLRLPKGTKLLSVGAGMGQIERFLVSPFGLEVTMVDFNLPSLEVARGLFGSKINMATANALELPFQNRAFDAVISYDFMEHLPDETAASKAFSEMERVMKRDGPMFHKITVLGEEGMEQDPTHHLKMSASVWQKWFQGEGWATFKPLRHSIPIWSRRKIGLYSVHGAFYLRKAQSLG